MTMMFPKTKKEWLELRHQYVSSTESAALFGLSPWNTAFELAVAKKEPLPPVIEQNTRMQWGLRLQDAIAKGISEDYGVKVRRVRGYAAHDTARLGASFDFELVGVIEESKPEDPMLQQMYRDLGPGILEIKNVDGLIFRQQWKQEDGQLEAPAHVEIQMQQELECIKRKWGVLGVLFGGNDSQLVIRERDEEVGKAIISKVNEFWALLDGGGMPPVKLPEDVEIIRHLYMGSTPGKVKDLQGNEAFNGLCKSYNDAKESRDMWEEARKIASARILLEIGDAERVLADGFKISAGTVGDTVVESFTRKGFRNLRVTEKKVVSK